MAPEVNRGTFCSSEVVFNAREKAPKEFYIKKGDAEKHGYTRGCHGCSSWRWGSGRQPHTLSCQRRGGKIFKTEARVVNAHERMKDFKDRQIEKKMRKEEVKKRIADPNDDGDQDDLFSS